MKIRKYKLLCDSTITDAKEGDIVFDYMSHDYGLANADSRLTGVEHTSITLDPAGGSPSFTHPKHQLKEIK